MNLEVVNYTKIIHGFTVLSHINLSFTGGHIYGICGEKGSGKTSLFRAIIGQILPTEGDVLVNQRSIIKDNANFHMFGTLIDQSDFYLNLTGFDNLMLLYQINNRPNKAYILKQMKRFGLEDYAHKRYDTYPLEMRQRLKILQALMENQTIILLDELFDGFHDQGILDITTILNEEKEKGKLILLSSEKETDLAGLCDQIYYMSQGKLMDKSKGTVS